MVMKAQKRSALRLFKKHFARLLTVIAIVVVSVGFMSGIGEVEGKIKLAADNFYSEQNVSDLYIKSKKPYGFSSDEIKLLSDKFGEDNIDLGFSYEIKTDGKILRVYCIDVYENEINKLKLLDGALPENDGEILAERGTNTLDGYGIDDVLTIGGKDYTVCGTVLNPLVINKDEEPSMQYGDEYLNNIVYIHSEQLPIVNDVYVTLEDRALFNGYSNSYEKRIDTLKSETEALLGSDSAAVLSLYENVGLYSLISYAEKVGLIGIVFVVFFLAVTLLVVYSTMSRLLDEERAQIACQKTLGYTDTETVGKYLLFVLVGTVIGGLLSFGVGLGLTQVVYFAFKIQYEMPAFPSAPSVSYYLVTFGIIVLSTLILTFFTAIKTASPKPAVLLTPKAPRAGKKVWLERIPLIWNRLSFRYKSTFRNVFLFKSRFFMTVVSVTGSTVLVFCGMGLMDCATKQLENGGSLITVSAALIIFSALLCALVIYNLTNINVSERNREIATLMVLGYSDAEVTGYIFREIYIMSFIGALLGLPCGALFIKFVFSLIDFGSVSDINWYTWVLTPIITMVFSFIATRLLYKKITKTDMNASLKTLE